MARIYHLEDDFLLYESLLLSALLGGLEDRRDQGARQLPFKSLGKPLEVLWPSLDLCSELFGCDVKACVV